MCQRAYFSFNLIAKENQIKAFQGAEDSRIASIGSETARNDTNASARLEQKAKGGAVEN